MSAPEERSKDLGIAHRRLLDFVRGNFYEDPIAEEEDRDVWAGFNARLDMLIDAARKAGPLEQEADPPALTRCDRCGEECYDFQQWMTGLRTCLICTIHLHAVNACHMACPGCLAGLGLTDGDGSGTRRFHPDDDYAGEIQECLAIKIRGYHGLGDGPLEDWISDRVSEPEEEK